MWARGGGEVLSETKLERLGSLTHHGADYMEPSSERHSVNRVSYLTYSTPGLRTRALAIMLKGLSWTEFSKNVCQVPGDWAKKFFLLIPAMIIIKKKNV